MELGELLRAASVAAELRGDGSVEIRDLAYDSRRPADGTLFFCFAGEKTDGHDFAAGRGRGRRLGPGGRAPARPRRAPGAGRGRPGGDGADRGGLQRRSDLGADRGRDHRHQRQDDHGLPGPAPARVRGHHCGLLGTVQQVVGGQVEEVERTTPEAIDLQRTFDRMLESGDEYCAMEVSSHALVLHRADAIHFAVKVFTNLSQDHLDFHADMEDYFAAKRLLFSGGGRRSADRAGGRRLGAQRRRSLRPAPRGGALDCGSDGDCVTLLGRGRRCRPERPRRHLRHDPARASSASRRRARSRCGSPLPGDFNVSNALAALASPTRSASTCARPQRPSPRPSRCPAASSRSTRVSPSRVIVDYAHTPDSLENVLGAARRLTGGRLISVFGAGGDRDREKRPLMGRAGAELSDVAVVTSDNPRSEEPAAIIEQIEAGIDDRASRGGRGRAGPAGGDRDRPRSRRARATRW